MSSMRVAQLSEPGASFEIVERDMPEPGPGHVRITVDAVGICHTDELFVDGLLPGVSFPLVPGHEVAGRIDAVGEGVQYWKPGARVAVGWFGGNCGHCPPCRAGDFIHCRYLQIPGAAYDGGYASHMVAPVSALSAIPDELTAVEAAPLGCAGVTAFEGLRTSGARAGDLVAVIGIGGIGHLAVQYAAASGFETVAIARGGDKRELALQLGAHHYIDSSDGDTGAKLQQLGGARVVLGTAANSKAIGSGVAGLAPNGRLIVIGLSPESMGVSPNDLVVPSKGVAGHPSGTASEVEGTMRFSVMTGVRPMTETAPLEQVNEAYARALAGDVRFRMILVP